ncbi:hypothetical protein EOE67_08440 [Rheinheimera riviphila]|uniref:Uncharacterized protein n=1 Tax=Rheinheimera riviphila TaxID=1834037 RepID=A0A437QZI7_9GAMM|nr:hypothetical protein [Rheinheimera riviphila]RVU39929.1 hypothetical protein EOE67_08440 [Rheinheimera riviphila]
MHLKTCAVLILMMPAAFASSVDLKTQLQSCQQISDEEQRLSCFDQIVSQLDNPVQQQAVATTTVNPVVTTTATKTPVIQPPQATPKQEIAAEFGLKKPRPDAEIEEISSVVKTVAQDLRKKLLITLENGQQWRQLDQEYLNIQAGDRCVVKRGAIGSFLLGIEGTKKKIRVRRVE